MFDIIKIKIKSIAEEQRIIRSQERKQIRAARRLRIRQALEKADLTDIQKSRIMRRANKLGMKKISAPPSGSKEYIDASMSLNWRMKYHRVELAQMQRAAYIAYGFLRGKPFKTIEQFSYTIPPWDEALRNVKKFGDSKITEQVIAQRFAQWIDEAGSWKEKPADWKPSPKREKKPYTPKVQS